MENCFIGNIPALELVERYGSPIYVYDTHRIKTKYHALSTALQKIPHRIHYACKANEAPEILKLIKNLGAGLDTVSPNELKRALSLEFKAEDVIFTPSCPAIEELKLALEKQGQDTFRGIRIL